SLASLWLSSLYPATPRRIYAFFPSVIHAAPTPDIYPLSLHDALPIFEPRLDNIKQGVQRSLMLVTALAPKIGYDAAAKIAKAARSEEHTSELQSLTNLVCRLLLEKKTKWPFLPPSAVMILSANAAHQD